MNQIRNRKKTGAGKFTQRNKHQIHGGGVVNGRFKA